MPRPRPSVQTVELTSKRYKAWQAIGIGILLIGACVFIASPGIIGGILFLIGLITWIVAKVQAWWHHG